MSREHPVCGTRAAYDRHRKVGETPCKPCVEANRERSRRAKADCRAKLNVAPLPVPTVVQGADDMGPCTRPENGFLWDPRHEGEHRLDSRARWLAARQICVTACPVFSRCERERPVDPRSVWAGRVPRVRGERK